MVGVEVGVEGEGEVVVGGHPFLQKLLMLICRSTMNKQSNQMEWTFEFTVDTRFDCHGIVTISTWHA